MLGAHPFEDKPDSLLGCPCETRLFKNLLRCSVVFMNPREKPLELWVLSQASFAVVADNGTGIALTPVVLSQPIAQLGGTLLGKKQPDLSDRHAVPEHRRNLVVLFSAEFDQLRGRLLVDRTAKILWQVVPQPFGR